MIYTLAFLGEADDWSVGIVAFFISMTALGLGLAGVALLTRPEPGNGGRADRAVARWARVAYAFLSISVLWMWFCILTGFTEYSEIPVFLSIAISLQVTPLLLWLIMTGYLRRILRRIPSRRLVRQATTQFWGTAIAGSFFLVAQGGYFYWMFNVVMPAFAAANMAAPPPSSDSDDEESDSGDSTAASTQSASGSQPASAPGVTVAAMPVAPMRGMYYLVAALSATGIVLLGIIIGGAVLLWRTRRALIGVAGR
jgi:hypothetical protein